MQIESFYPAAAIVGQDNLKKAFYIALINPKAGGLLIGGKKGTAKTTLVRSGKELIDKRIVEIPLNITEDRLFGSIDLENAVLQGEKKFSKGLLADADNNILYIDEVNLLRSELLSAILNVNAQGENIVERDGISYRHAASFILIASMNPEEGVFSRAVLDRFGMYVDVDNISDISMRVELVKRYLDYEKDKANFRKSFYEQTEELKLHLRKAAELLPNIAVNEDIIKLASLKCTKAHCAGHRAELYLIEVAKTLAALEFRNFILPKDLDEAAVFVLPHRIRQIPEEQSEDNNKDFDDNESNDKNNSSDEISDDADEQNNDKEQEDDFSLTPDTGNNADDREDEQEEKNHDDALAPEEQRADIDKSFAMPKILLDLGKDRLIRRGSGKRSCTKTDLKQGRYVRSEIKTRDELDLAFDATLRAAAPYQKLRQKNNCALVIEKADLRQKIREKRIGNTFLFAVDASGSMGARERMRAVKGAIFYMLQEAYQKRDRVGLIAFRKNKAEILLPVTRSVDLARKYLQDMPTGGKTPLADGLLKALQVLEIQNKKDKDLEPVLIVVTDGKANFAVDNENPIDSALHMAEKIRKSKVTSVVIDTENDFIKLGIAKDLASRMGASYYALDKLSKENIVRIVRNVDKGRF